MASQKSETFEGTERRDIVFTNDSDESFWEYIRTEHAGLFVMFEAKNTRCWILRRSTRRRRRISVIASGGSAPL